jgi:hypothetical protein
MPDAMTEEDVNRYFGGKLLNSLMVGTGMGAGGMGLWYLAKHLRNKQKSMEQKPDLFALASEPPALPAPPKMAFDASSLALPAGGAGIGALIGAIRARKGKKMRGALSGAGAGSLIGTAGAALSSPEAQEFVGRNIPKNVPIFSALFGDNGGPAAPTGTYQAAANIGALGLGGLGAYGGTRAVQSLMADEQNTKHKDTVEGARDEYFKTLLGEKSSVSAVLDNVYDAYEKESGILWNDPKRGPWDSNALVNSFRNLSGSTQTLVGLASLAAAGVGAKHMYDATSAKSNAKLLNQAREARMRMQMSQTPWIDPVELAQIKKMAPHESANERDV